MADEHTPDDEPTAPKAPAADMPGPETDPGEGRDWLIDPQTSAAPAPPEAASPAPQSRPEPVIAPIDPPPPPPMQPASEPYRFDPPPPDEAPPPARAVVFPVSPPPRRRRGLIWRLIVALLVVVFVIPPAWVLVYRVIPPPATSLMFIRQGQGQGWDYRWTPLSHISPALVQAAIGAEDARFCEHHGFDYRAMQKAMAHNERRPGKVRGGSTISQQTAKNVFLWPDRSYVRKGLEAYFTVLIETIWGKRRIMETYLNVVEMGPGIYGAEAAAQRYFHTDAAHLTNLQASRLAAILPDPLKWHAVAPGAYVQRRSRRIGGAIGTVRTDGLAACVGKLSGYVPAEPPVENAAPPPPPAPKSSTAAPEAVPPDVSAAPSPAPETPAPAAPDAAPAPDTARPPDSTPEARTEPQ